MIIQAVLEQLGLSPNEAKIYVALIDLKEAGVGAIASYAKIHRRSVYEAVSRLVHKGLIFPVLSHGKNTYTPADPETLNSRITDQKMRLKSIFPELTKQYHARSISQEAYVYHGVEGFKNYLRDVIREEKDLYAYANAFGWMDPEVKNLTKEIFKKFREKKLSLYYIFADSVKTKGGDLLKNFVGDYRFLPKKYPMHAATDIFGDYIATFTDLPWVNVKNVTIYILRDRRLANSYRSWFHFMFLHCRK